MSIWERAASTGAAACASRGLGIPDLSHIYEKEDLILCLNFKNIFCEAKKNI